jgi:tape measure domain-containing protein
MADDITVPIKLPTDSSSVSAAKDVVISLADRMKALGPAAAAGSAQAQSEMRALGAAAVAAQKEVARSSAVQATREARGNAPARSADESKARERAEAAAGQAAVKAIDDERRKSDRDAAKRAKDKAAFDAKHARDTAEIQRSFMKGAQDKRAADMKELQSSAMGAVSVVASLAAAVAALSAKFVSALVSAQAFRESTMGAFTSLLKSSGAADKAFKDTIRTADEIGISYKDALSGVNSLLAKGFKADQAQDLVKAMADLKSVVPDANIGNLLLAVTQIKSKGVLQMEELQGQIAEAGLSVSVVLEEIGKGIGKSGQEVRKMISQGQISADQGVAGIMAAIQKTTGKPIGKAAAEASKSLGGLLSRLEQIPEGLLLMAEPTAGLKTLKSALGNVIAAFAPSSESGKALASAIGKLGDAFGTFISGLSGEGGAALLKDFAGSLALATERAADLVTKIGLLTGPALTEFVKGFSEASKLMGGKGAQSSAEGYAELGKALGTVGRALGWIAATAGDVKVLFGGAGILFELVGTVQQASGALSGLWDSIKSAIGSAAQAIHGAAQAVGTNLVQGIIAGISLASPALAMAIQGLAAMSTSTATAAHQIHSPSKEWRDDIGYQLPAGQAEGIYDGAPLVQRAARDVAGMATAAGSGAASGATGGGAHVINITINAPGSDPLAIRNAIDAWARDFFGGVQRTGVARA